MQIQRRQQHGIKGQMIAEMKSRQDKTPPIGKYIDKARVDPLHVANLAWQHWYLKLVSIIQNHCPDRVVKQLKSIHDLEPCPLKEHLSLIQKLRFGQVRKKIIRQVMDDGVDTEISNL